MFAFIGSVFMRLYEVNVSEWCFAVHALCSPLRLSLAHPSSVQSSLSSPPFF